MADKIKLKYPNDPSGGKFKRWLEEQGRELNLTSDDYENSFKEDPRILQKALSLYISQGMNQPERGGVVAGATSGDPEMMGSTGGMFPRFKQDEEGRMVADPNTMHRSLIPNLINAGQDAAAGFAVGSFPGAAANVAMGQVFGPNRNSTTPETLVENLIGMGTAGLGKYATKIPGGKALLGGLSGAVSGATGAVLNNQYPKLNKRKNPYFEGLKGGLLGGAIGGVSESITRARDLAQNRRELREGFETVAGSPVIKPQEVIDNARVLSNFKDNRKIDLANKKSIDAANAARKKELDSLEKEWAVTNDRDTLKQIRALEATPDQKFTPLPDVVKANFLSGKIRYDKLTKEEQKLVDTVYKSASVEEVLGPLTQATKYKDIPDAAQAVKNNINILEKLTKDPDKYLYPQVKQILLSDILKKEAKGGLENPNTVREIFHYLGEDLTDKLFGKGIHKNLITKLNASSRVLNSADPSGYAEDTGDSLLKKLSRWGSNPSLYQDSGLKKKSSATEIIGGGLLGGVPRMIPGGKSALKTAALASGAVGVPQYMAHGFPDSLAIMYNRLDPKSKNRMIIDLINKFNDNPAVMQMVSKLAKGDSE